jgi:hypothetical protein
MNKEKTKLIIPKGTHPQINGTMNAQTVDDLIELLQKHKGKKIGLDNWNGELWIIDEQDEDYNARIHLSVLN